MNSTPSIQWSVAWSTIAATCKHRQARLACAVAVSCAFTLTASAQSPTLSLPVGFIAGLLAHESGHVTTAAAFDARAHLRGVHFHGIPFFAVAHRSGLPRREEFVVSSAGFWMQHATSEVILTAHPALWRDGHWFETGVVAFGIATSAAYAGAAWARTGPSERDTRGMAATLGVAEPVIGTIVLLPALLDGYRAWRPLSRRAAWTSRGVKAGLMLLPIACPP